MPKSNKSTSIVPYTRRSPKLVDLPQSGAPSRKGVSSGGRKIAPKRTSKQISLSKLLSMSDFLGNQPFSANVAYGQTMKSKLQKLSMKDGSLLVSHKELIEPALLGSTTFTNQLTIPLNPGLSGFSTWLSEIAKNYEEYEFEEIVVHYITRTSTATAGSIGICMDYDPTDQSPESEIQASQMPGTTESVVWKDLTVPASTRNLSSQGRRRFVRTGPALGDIKNYDNGNIFIYTNDCANTNPIGKIWLSYRVRLMIPQSPNAAAVTKPTTCTSFCNPDADQNCGGSPGGLETKVKFPVERANPLSFNMDVEHQNFIPPAGAYRTHAQLCVFSTDLNPTQWRLGLYQGEVELDTCRCNVTQTTQNAGLLPSHLLVLDTLVNCDGLESFSYRLRVINGASADSTILQKSATFIWNMC